MDAQDQPHRAPLLQVRWAGAVCCAWACLGPGSLECSAALHQSEPRFALCSGTGRWAVAIIPEVQTILAYYSDGGTLKVYSRSPWEDTDVPSKHKVLQQYLKRYRWLPGKEYDSMVDIIMDVNTFESYLEHHLDVDVLLAARKLKFNHDMLRKPGAGPARIH